MPLHIKIDHGRITAFCHENLVIKLALFGSVLRDDFRPDSDVDVLVWFEPDAHITLFDMVRMENDLGAIIGRKVDLRTPEDLSRLFRQAVVEEAEVQYAA
jgi:predicted nucleotidyltransferase